LEKALEEVEKTGNTKKGQKEKDKVRVSKSDPESRIMKQGNGGYGPSYNVQISTDAKEGIIVGVGVCQSASDYNELEKAVDEIERTMKQTPEQMVADGGYTSRENIIMMGKRGIEYIGSMQDAPNQAEKMLKKHGVNLAFAASAFNYVPKEDQYLCPGGKHLPYLGRKLNPGKTEYIYRAESNDCHACQFKSQCCPNAKNGRSVIRSVEDPAVIAFKKKMETESAKAIYQQRGPIAEFPNARLKEQAGSTALAARYGGEEFAVLLPNTPKAKAYQIAKAISSVIQASFIEVGGVRLNITVSCGVSTYPEDAIEQEELITAADQALYEAKRNGRNLVMAFTPSFAKPAD
jgi:hypothetical protein